MFSISLSVPLVDPDSPAPLAWTALFNPNQEECLGLGCDGQLEWTGPGLFSEGEPFQSGSVSPPVVEAKASSPTSRNRCMVVQGGDQGAVKMAESCALELRYICMCNGNSEMVFFSFLYIKKF